MFHSWCWSQDQLGACSWLWCSKAGSCCWTKLASLCGWDLPNLHLVAAESMVLPRSGREERGSICLPWWTGRYSHAVQDESREVKLEAGFSGLNWETSLGQQIGSSVLEAPPVCAQLVPPPWWLLVLGRDCSQHCPGQGFGAANSIWSISTVERVCMFLGAGTCFMPVGLGVTPAARHCLNSQNSLLTHILEVSNFLPETLSSEGGKARSPSAAILPLGFPGSIN